MGQPKSGRSTLLSVVRLATKHAYALVRRQAAARRQQLSGSAGHSSLKEFRISLRVRYLSESSISLKEFDALSTHLLRSNHLLRSRESYTQL